MQIGLVARADHRLKGRIGDGVAQPDTEMMIVLADAIMMPTTFRPSRTSFPHHNDVE